MAGHLQEGRTPIRSTIVVGVDGSEHSRLALRWASDEARRRDSELRVMYGQITAPEHVPSWYRSGSSGGSPAQAVVRDAVAYVERREPLLTVHGEVVEWPPATVLTSASRSAELLVVGARGLGGFEELLLGSVSDQCLQYAHCPVVVIHSADIDQATSQRKHRIVVGLDGSLGSTRALRWALDEALFRSADVKAIVAWEYDPLTALLRGPAHGHEALAREVADAAADHAQRLAPQVPFTAEACFDATVPALLDASLGADLLVVGSRGHGGLEAALLGSVAHQCARHALSDVVIVRPHISEERTARESRSEQGKGHKTKGGSQRSYLSPATVS